MNPKLYQNEIIIAVAFIVMLFGALYKQSVINGQIQKKNTTQSEMIEIQKAVNLKELWASTDTDKSILKLKSLLPDSKVEWKQKGKKLEARFSSLTSNELNRLVSTVLSSAIEIKTFEILHEETYYQVRLGCKW